jgi:SNF family Na+-dependent transporter
MRRIDVIAWGIGILGLGGVLFLVFQWSGLDSLDAGIWSQLLFMAVVVGWVATYLFRAFTQNMTYNQQLKDYERAVLQKRLDEMTPEELAQLQAELDAESNSNSSDSGTSS